jgi:hypothetical protein
VRHVLGLEMMLADRAADHLLAVPILPRRAGNIEAALRRPGDERSHHEGDGKCEERRKRLQRRAQKAAKCRNADDGRGEHGADADRIDVVEIGALEFDARRTKAQRLVDHQVGDQCTHPRHRHDGVKSKRVLQHLENAELHQHQRNGHVEHEPDHASGMAMRQAREEIRPGDGARIGVSHIDLELGDDDKRAGEGERHLRRGEHIAESDKIHARRLDRFRQRHEMLDREESQERPGEQLQHSGNDPAGTGGEIGRPPGALAGRAARRQKPQEVDLLTDLGDQRKDDGGGGSKQDEIERSPADAGDPGELGPAFERCAINGRDKDEGQEMQHDPCWLRPELKPADESNAMRHQRNHDQRAEHVAYEKWDAQTHLEGERHDRGFDGEEEEGERGIDQRGDCRSEIAEAGAAREQIDIHAIGRCVIGDRQTGQQDEDADDNDGGSAVDEAVIDGDRAADGFQRQKRNSADGGVGDAQARPAARGLGGEAKRVVFQCLVRDPLIVIAPNANDALLRCHELHYPKFML